MRRLSLTRRELLQRAVPRVREGQPRVPPPGTNDWLRRIIFMAVLLCWLPLLCVSVTHQGLYHASVLTIGLPGSPWLEYRSAGVAWSGIMVHATSWSALLGFAGWVLLRTYRRPRALAATRRLFREMRR